MNLDDRYYILALAEKQLKKQLEQINKEIQKKSEQYRNMHIDKVTHTRRRKARFNLESICAERDRIERRLDEVNNWFKELRLQIEQQENKNF